LPEEQRQYYIKDINNFRVGREEFLDFSIHKEGSYTESNIGPSGPQRRTYSAIYDDNSAANAQMSVTATMTVTKDDCRDYFINTTGINDGRFNCLSLCLAWTDVFDGFTYYQDIRPFTRINFPNKFLNDLTSEWLITYHIYF